MVELSDLAAFARVADLGGVSAAARALGLLKSTVSRALSRLEAEVGALLVDRSSRHVRLTEAGALFHGHARRILGEVQAAGAALDGLAGVPRGTLRVSAPFTLAVSLLSPRLPAFTARCPEVRVVLDVENRVLDIPAEPADLVIRAATALPDSDLVARRLFGAESWTCASPGYLARRGVSAEVGELASHALLAYADGPTTWTCRTAAGGERAVLFSPAATVSDSVALLPALVGGAGIGRLPDFVARDAVARGDLVRLFPEDAGEVYGVHALYPSHRALTAKVHAFIDALVDHVARRPEPATGGDPAAG